MPVEKTADPSATLGMTKGRAALPSGVDDVGDQPQVPPLRYAPVGMTTHLQGDDAHSVKLLTVNGVTKLSSRPERSAVEGPAVLLISFRC